MTYDNTHSSQPSRSFDSANDPSLSNKDQDQLLGMVQRAADGTLSRRGFVALAAAIGAGQLVASQLGPVRRAFGAAGPTTARPPVPGGSIGAGNLITIFLGGGNDGLNTLVPFGDAEYHRLRPSIKLMPNEVLSLGADVPLGLHPSLVGLQARYLQGKVALITGVGYNAPDLSHFNSQDHWESGWGAPGSGILPLQTGWIGRWLDTTNPGPFGAISFRADDRSVVGANVNPIRLRPWDSDLTGAPTTDAMELLAQTAFQGLTGPTGLGTYANSLGAVLGSALSAGAVVGPALKNIPNGTSYIGRQMLMAGRLLNAGVGARAITTVHGGFDTHSEQALRGQDGHAFGWHGKLLADLDVALDLLFATMTPAVRANTTVLVYSEFGRRVEENGSYGTDHGTSGLAMVVGDGVNGGIFGEQPSLLTLDSNDNMLMNVDFRSVYATLLSRFLGADDTSIVGAAHQRLLLSAADAATVSSTTTSSTTTSSTTSSSTSTSTSTSTSIATTTASTVAPTTGPTSTTSAPTTVSTSAPTTVGATTTPTTEASTTTTPTTAAPTTTAPTTAAPTTAAPTTSASTTSASTTMTPPTTAAATTVTTTQPGTTAAASSTLATSSTTSSSTSTTLARTTTTVPTFPPPVVVNPGPGPKTPADPDPVTIVRTPPAPAPAADPPAVPPTVGFDKGSEPDQTTTIASTSTVPQPTVPPTTRGLPTTRVPTTLPKQLALKPKATKRRTTTKAKAKKKVTTTRKRVARTASRVPTTKK